MRLTEKQIEVIKESFVAHFLPGDKLWLFGSRVDDSKKGGDIDLYIETMYEETEEVLDKKIWFLVDIKKGIGDQKIDVVTNEIKRKRHIDIYDEARNTGVRLV